MISGVPKLRNFSVGLKALACIHPSETIVITISHLIGSLDRDLKVFFFTIEHILKPDKIYQSTTKNTHNHLKFPIDHSDEY